VLRGKVRLDGAALDQWPKTELGLHVGFLPQEVELFAGTIAENIGRFEPNAPFETVIAAARAAGVHEMVLRLPEGYNTRIGEGGAGLSAGQRQRVGLARALYRDPFLVVLDEPNSNLDAEGEGALTEAIRGIRRRGGICVVVAHRPSALAAVDLVLMMAEGRVQAFGPKDEILKRVLRPTSVPPAGQIAEARPPAGPMTLQESA
jgi:ATP-binding cassette subfamily C protein